MADSVRLAILKHLSNYLATEVTVANGYSHDLKDSVFRGRLYFAPDEPLPAISILEGINPDREPSAAGYDMQTDVWSLLLQGWSKDDKLNPTDPAHALLADVKMALGKLIQRYARLQLAGTPMVNVTKISVEPGVVRPPDEISSRAYFWMRLQLQVVEELEDPFYRG